jgi:sugar phosphate isomerase/epimerase
MFKIGFSATYGFNNITDVINYGAANGFSAVEINLNMPEFFPDRYSQEERETIKKLADDKNILLTFHGPEDINLCSKQKTIVKTSVELLKASIDFACDLGGSRLTFHIGDSVNFTLFDRSLRMEEYYAEDYVKLLIPSLEELCKYTGGRIFLCAENTGYFSDGKQRAIEYMLGKGLYLTWDLGHAYLKKNQMDFMTKNSEYVRNMHIHDVCDRKDHCIIGTGEVDIPGYISKMNPENVTLIIEVRPHEAAVKSLDNLKKQMNI